MFIIIWSKAESPGSKKLILIEWDGNLAYFGTISGLTYAPVTSHSRAPIPRLFWTKIVHPLTGPARAPCSAVRILPSRRVLMPRTGFEILNSPWTARAGTARGLCGPLAAPVWPNTMPLWDFCQFWLYQFPYVYVTVSYGTLAGPARAPHRSRRIWKTLKIPLQGPYGARMGTAWGTHGVLRIIRPNHKCTTVSSRMGPVAWYDHENSTDVSFLRALHSASRARNCMGDKNRTGLVVGFDWGIIQVINSKARVIFID